MRWPWTRRAAEPPPQPATATTPAADPPAAPSPMGWAFLPPIQRTLAPPIATVTRPVEFPGELSAWRSPAFTDSLSHAVVDTSSGGVIDGDGGGLGHPTNTSAHAPELTAAAPTAPDRRAAVGPSARGGSAPRHGVRVGRGGSGPVAHSGTLGRDAARPARRHRRSDAGPDAAARGRLPDRGRCS